jgi:glycosyltransferase involved in cell wall biosynthesis
MENLHPVVSVIIPVFNGERFLKETIDSLINEKSKTNIEIIAVNDGSTDSTQHILEQYGDQIKYYYQENSGQSSAINFGIEKANGKYCSIVNSDDPILDTEIYEISSKILDAKEDVIATYPNWVIIDEEGAIIRNIDVVDYSELELVGKFNCIIGPGGVFRTNIGRSVGGWDTSIKYIPDYDFWLKLSRFGIFEKIPRTLAAWRHHSESISVKSKNFKMANERISVIENFISTNNLDKKMRNSALSYVYYSAAVLSYFDPNIDARHLFWKSVRINPKIIFNKKLTSNLYLMAYPYSRKILQFIKYKIN